MIIELQNSDKKQIEKIQKDSGNCSSANSFMAMYMWRNVYGEKIYVSDNCYSLKIKDEDNAWFFPCGQDSEKIDFIRNRLEDRNLILKYATDDDVDYINRYFADKFQIKNTPESSEYLYNVESHINLSGKKYSRIRREIHNVSNKHEFEIVALDDDNAKYIWKIEEKWLQNRPASGTLNTSGEELDLNIFKDIKGNNIFGIILLENNQPVAAVAGFLINDNVVDVFYGAQTNEVNSSLDYALYEFAKRMDPKIEFFNLEEDLGIEGLRYWKNKLQPAKMINMWECVQL